MPFIVVGGAAIVAGGLLSAATAFAPSYLASWAVAYLVLVVGVAQVALGLGQALLASEPPSRRVVAAEVVLFDVGNAGVMAGSLVGPRVLSLVGSGLLLVVLAAMLWAVRRPAHRGWPLHLYRLVLVILFVSIPIGLRIASVRG